MVAARIDVKGGIPIARVKSLTLDFKSETLGDTEFF